MSESTANKPSIMSESIKCLLCVAVVFSAFSLIYAYFNELSTAIKISGQYIYSNAEIFIWSTMAFSMWVLCMMRKSNVNKTVCDFAIILGGIGIVISFSHIVYVENLPNVDFFDKQRVFTVIYFFGSVALVFMLCAAYDKLFSQKKKKKETTAS